MAKKILADHKKTGKIFQPPILTLGTFVETAWVDYAVPEFIWILLLIEKHGVEGGSRLCLEFLAIVDPFIISKVNNGTAASIISFYTLLTDIEKKAILIELNKKSILRYFQIVFEPFLKLYPECPLLFIVSKIKKDRKLNSKYLIEYKNVLNKLLDKTGFESSIVIANVVNFLVSVDRIKITEKSNIPHLKEILHYPKTEESKHLASFLRSTISMCFNTEWGYNRNNTWITYFWNQGIKIEPYKL